MSHKVYNIEVYKHAGVPYGCIRLFWEGSSGFGQYDLVIETGSDNPDESYKLGIEGDSECMDCNGDKSFIKELLLSLVDSIDIVG